MQVRRLVAVVTLTHMEPGLKLTVRGSEWDGRQHFFFVALKISLV